MEEAVRAFKESLEMRRKLAETNPAAYLPNVAMTLNPSLELLAATLSRLR